MKNVFLGILREIGIAILILVVLAAVIVVVFKDKLPYDEVIPSGDKYVKVNRNTYSVTSTDRISEVNTIVITHESEQGNILDAENQVRIQTGKYTPFGTIDSSSDLPTERVGVTVAIPEDTNTNQSAGSTSSNDNLQYPSTDDPIKKIEMEQSESSESAATRRFNNVKSGD